MSFKLVTLVVIVLGAIAIAQLVRLYEHSSKLRNRREEDIPNRDNKLNANMMLTFMILLFAGFIWLMISYGFTGRGEAASEHGKTSDWLLDINFLLVIIIFFITNFLLFYFSFKYVRKPGVKAYFYPHNNKLELIWTVVPAIVLAFIIILGLKTWNTITADASKEAVRIELFSEQFKWTARYSGDDNKLGYFDYKLTTTTNQLGLLTGASLDSAIRMMEIGSSDGTILGIKLLEEKLNNPKNIFIPKDRVKMEEDLDRKTRLLRLLYQMQLRHNSNLDARAYDDVIEADTLHLVKNQDYEFNFRAKDVIHSAYFPHFRAQINAVPGLTTRFKFKPTISTKEMKKKMNNPDFNFVLMCNKICGGAHYKMKMIVVVDSPSTYKKWMKTKKTFKDEFLAAPAPAAAETPADSLVVAVN
jgi:cytochrome c oxidase subunit 2